MWGGKTVRAGEFFQELKEYYNINKVSVRDLINTSKYWANHHIGRLFAHMFNIQICVFSTNINREGIITVNEDIWYSPPHVTDLDSSSQIKPVTKAYMHHVNSNHYNILDY